MPNRDIFVIGASAGGLESLLELVPGLPKDFPAPILVVLHLSPTSFSNIPGVLAHAGQLPASFARTGEPIKKGHIYIAPPDNHMALMDGRIELNRGPRENYNRPSIDVLMRTAAETYRSRVVGILLSGYLSDGTLGLTAIKLFGGETVVQDPQEARIPNMPRHAIEHLQVDHVFTIEQIQSFMIDRANSPTDDPSASNLHMMMEMNRPQEIISQDKAAQEQGKKQGKASFYTCPECGGVMWQVNLGSAIQFVCHTGHRYSMQGLMDQMAETTEMTIRAAIRALVERSTLARQMAEQAKKDGDPESAARWEQAAQADEHRVHIIHTQVAGDQPTE